MGRKVSDAFDDGEYDRVGRYWDDTRSSFVDIAKYAGSPAEGMSSYSTLGLSAYPLMDGTEEMPFRIEICGAADDGWNQFPHMLASAAFEVMGGEYLYPDRILGGIVESYYPDLAMKHLLFMSPFLWGDRLQSFDAGGRTVAWLQAFPISEAEMQYGRSNSVDALTDLLQQREVDPVDLSRPSAI